MSFHDSSSAIPGDGQQIQIMPDGMVRFGNDTQTNVVFYKKSCVDIEKSRMAGRRIEVGVDYVRIQHPGERDTIDTPVANKPDAPLRWPRQWAQYRQSQEQIPEGTPTSMLPYFIQHPEIPANLTGSGVYTLEQLANLSEHAAQSIGMGVTQWRNMARDFLEKANKGVGIHKMEAELQKRDNEIEVLKNNLAQAVAQIDRLAAAQQGVPGAMIPAARPTLAQAQSAAVAPAYDWSQAHVHQASQGLQSFPAAEAHESHVHSVNTYVGDDPAELTRAEPAAVTHRGAENWIPPERDLPNATALDRDEPPPKARGWPKGKPRKPRADAH